MNVGLALYACCHPKWPVSASFDAFGDVSTLRLSYLHNTFGRSERFIRHLLDDPREKAIEIHLLNEVGHRNNRLGKYELLHGIGVEEYERKLRQVDPRLGRRITDYAKEALAPYQGRVGPSLDLLLSPGLESNLSPRAFDCLLKLLRPLVPVGTRFVWNPAGINKASRRLIPDTVHELHVDGDHLPDLKPPCIVNLDGTDIHFAKRPAILPRYMHESQLPKYLRRYERAEANFLWLPECNGISPGKFIDPRKRSNFPSRKTFELLRGVLMS